MREGNKRTALTIRPTSALVRKFDLVERRVVPLADVVETERSFILRLDMPGTSKDLIAVTVEPGHLSVKGILASHLTGAIVHSEIGRKSYLREFNLGNGIDYRDVDAMYVDGVLSVTLSKTESMKSREIQIT